MNSRRILPVEDNPSDIKLTKRALERGHILNEMDVVGDGLEAPEYLLGEGRHRNREVIEQPALVLLDLKLPKIDGLEVLRRIRSDVRIRRLPVVILTSSKEERDEAESYDLA